MSQLLPSHATSENCNAGTCDPKLALLTDLHGAIQKLNALIDNLGQLATMAIGPGLQLQAQSAGVSDLVRVAAMLNARTEAYTIVPSDRGKLVVCDGSWTLSLQSASALGDGFLCYIANTGTGTITLTPYSDESICGQSTYQLTPKKGVLLIGDGSGWTLIGNAPIDSIKSIGDVNGAMAPTNGNVLTWNGSQWAAQAPNTGTNEWEYLGAQNLVQSTHNWIPLNTAYHAFRLLLWDISPLSYSYIGGRMGVGEWMEEGTYYNEQSSSWTFDAIYADYKPMELEITLSNTNRYPLGRFTGSYVKGNNTPHYLAGDLSLRPPIARQYTHFILYGSYAAIKAQGGVKIWGLRGH